MASSNKTSYMSLNQWTATDQVLRTDLNSDNSKIDNAVKIRSMLTMEQKTIISATETILTNLSGWVMSDFMQLQLHLYPKVSAASVTTIAVNSEAPISLAEMTTDGTKGLIIDLCLMPGGIVGKWVAPGSDEEGHFVFSGITASKLASITLASSSDSSTTYQTGTLMRIYGIRR